MERQRWLRLQIPESAHSKIKDLAKENRTGVAKQAGENLILSTQETGVLERVIKFVNPSVENIEVVRNGQLLSISWSENGTSKRYIFDTLTNEVHERIEKK